MPQVNVETQPTLKSLLANSPEIDDVSRQLAALALAQAAQDGSLGVRQTEQLRRALATAGDALGWPTAGGAEAIGAVGKDVLTMAKSGAKSMFKDLEDALTNKRTEVAQLLKTAEAARKISEDPKATYPAEMTFSFTARHATQDLVTKTETVTANDAAEALKAAENIEKSMTSREKLRDQMVIDLKLKQQKLDEMTKTLPDFLDSSRGLLKEVMAIIR